MKTNIKTALLTLLLVFISLPTFAEIINEHTYAIGNAKNVTFKRIQGGEIPNHIRPLKYVLTSATTGNYDGKINQNIQIFSRYGH